MCTRRPNGFCNGTLFADPSFSGLFSNITDTHIWAFLRGPYEHANLPCPERLPRLEAAFRDVGDGEILEFMAGGLGQQRFEVRGLPAQIVLYMVICGIAAIMLAAAVVGVLYEVAKRRRLNRDVERTWNESDLEAGRESGRLMGGYRGGMLLVPREEMRDDRGIGSGGGGDR